MADEQATEEEGGGGGGLQRFLMIFAFVFVIFIMFDNDLRIATGNAVGAVLQPIIGFQGEQPLLTLFLAGTVMILLSTGVRHVFVDWVRMAEVQETMKTFQREFKEARENNNTYKVKRLTELQPEVMSMQAELSGQQLKPMAVTMLVVIPIFAWLLHFVESIATVTTVVMPWNPTWSLTGNFWFMPRWILVYSLFSIPIGQLAQRILKLVEYSRDLDDVGEDAAAEGS